MPEPDRGVRKVFVIGLLGAVAAIALIVIVIAQRDRPQTPEPSAPQQQSVGISEIGLLSKGDGEIVPLGVTKADFDQMTKTLLAKDDVGWKELVTSGRVIGAEDGTKVRVIDTGVFWRQVRILEGPYQERSGYVPTEWVKPER